MSETQQTNECICNDESKTKECTCMNCQTVWSRGLDHHERVSKCPQHRMSIAICGGATRDFLCQACKDNGYYVESSGGGFFPKFEIKQKDEPVTI